MWNKEWREGKEERKGAEERRASRKTSPPQRSTYPLKERGGTQTQREGIHLAGRDTQSKNEPISTDRWGYLFRKTLFFARFEGYPCFAEFALIDSRSRTCSIPAKIERKRGWGNICSPNVPGGSCRPSISSAAAKIPANPQISCGMGRFSSGRGY
jgi:hypothetical protein